jgi:alkylation response protein AidB-like acyl-CoA dehydrogenase
MDLRLSREDEAFRDEVRAFLAASLPESIRSKTALEERISREEMVEWHRILNDRGWVAPHWPVEWGGTGWGPIRQYLFKEELQLAPAPDPYMQNINLVGPVLIAFGTEEQKQRFLPKLKTLEYWFCQGFSEPGAGSDLASLKTTAVRDGNHYVVTGQKIWTSRAHWSNWMFALVRTDPAERKQRGITYLLLEMDAPGVTVRPIITLDGDHVINEVFLDGVRTPISNRVGEENKGWSYAKFLLGNERSNIARVGLTKHRIRRAWEMAGKVREGGRPHSENPGLRLRLAAIEAEVKALEITSMRLVSEMARSDANDPNNIKASILKLKGTELQQLATEILFDIAGYQGLPVRGATAAMGLSAPEWAARTAPVYFNGRAASIYGGANEIQRNVVAKAILGA